ncbi:hypothetical protein BX589_102197 [Paraburkholderia fungorum]|jgi:hypothetical protein|uniref:SphA family protein n=1 Tax=Paraburkholderia fungorum TaxID=134537 RepID=UPI000D0563F6|nr:transporter [Paraburkholderia fungorum]PRZ55996.1 hypothetical protein BX589_102197 [Paraburkholderia fungorum]
MGRLIRSISLWILLSVACAALFARQAYATELWANTLPALNEGLASGALPPTGLYGIYDSYWASFRVYGNSSKSTSESVDALIQVPTLLWVPGNKIFGGRYAAAIALPFDYTNVKAPGVAALSDNGHWGTFNTVLAPVMISWQLPHDLSLRTDLAVAFDDASSTPGHPPTGGGAPSGNGFWSLEPDVGISWLHDGWNVSAGMQYAYNFKDGKTQYTSGQQLSGTYTLTKTMGKWTLGVGAYSINQISADSGSGALAAGCASRRGCRIEAYGAGPIVGYQFGGLNVLLNYTASIYTRNYLGGNIFNVRFIFPLN